MKTSRFQYQYRKNASSLHKSVGELLRNNSIFSGYDIYQEYPVSKVNPDYLDNSHHFDWVIPKLKIVIECHGKQHYEATSFIGDDDQAISSFYDLKRRDNSKKNAALEAGYTYIVVPYYEEKLLSQDYLLKLISTDKVDGSVPKQKKINKRVEEEKLKQKEQRQTYLKSDKHKKELILAREFRKQRYRTLKEKHQGENDE